MTTVCFMVCEHLHADMVAAAQAQGLTELEICPIPARCDGPAWTKEELLQLATQSKAEIKEFLIGSCFPQELEIADCQVRQLEQCFDVLISPTLAHSLQQTGAWLFTAGWLQCWQKKWEQNESVPSYNKLILLDTGVDPQAGQKLAEMAAALGLPAERMSIGLEYAGLFLAAATGEYRQKELQLQEEEARRKAAEAAMTLDMLGLVVKAASEPEVFTRIAELFTMLFAPRAVFCLPVTKGGLPIDRLAALTAAEQESVEQFLRHTERPYEVTDSGDSFFLRLNVNGFTAVIVLVRHITFPQYLYLYLNTALHVAGVCSLAIEHVRVLKKLLDTSRLAGKAEVATEILHNVGNIFNSISVASERLREIVQQSSCITLPPIAQLLEDQHENKDFWSNDPRGKKIPRYISSLSGRLAQEREQMLEEVNQQLRHIRRAAEIIRTQQDNARGRGLTEPLDLAVVIEESFDIFHKKIAERHINIVREYAALPLIWGQRHKILQIAGNLISNAAEAFDELEEEKERKIIVRLYPTPEKGSIIFEIEDNGKGINKMLLERIFNFGFTTKQGGHGFGLHNAANLATEIGGTLSAESAGKGEGALFRLVLPTAEDK
jgi:signal transduction histidine kinase